MSIITIHESNPKARKKYNCNACEFLFEVINDLTLTFSEMRLVIKARQNKYKILKGQKYIRQFNTDNNYTWTFRSIPEIHNICIKYDLYEG